MIEIFRSFIVGGIQGVSEFLPISSSGHLVLIPYLFKWNYNGLAFDVALHFGTLVAIIAYFWSDWKSIIANAIGKPDVIARSEATKQSSGTNTQIATPTARNDTMQYPKNLLWQLLVATIPAAVVGLLIQGSVESRLHSPLLIAGNLIFFGLILWLIDRYSESDKKMINISHGKSFLIGVVQSISLMPGVSRSGITMTAARSLGLDRESAARFSFLLAAPAMLGAFLLETKDINSSSLDISFLVGVIASAIFGFIAIKYLLQYLKKGSFVIFLWYRILIAAIVLSIYFTR